MTITSPQIFTNLILLLLALAPRVILAQISTEFVDSPVGLVWRQQRCFCTRERDVNRDSIRQIIRRELKKYPKGVLENKARLTKIIVSDTIFVSDDNGEFTRFARGSYFVPGFEGNSVFVDATSDVLPGILHHEISSVFLGELATSDTTFARKT